MRIVIKKIDYFSVLSRVGFIVNMDYRLGGGEKKVYFLKGMMFVNLFFGGKIYKY